jgi:hypothetical protein
LHLTFSCLSPRGTLSRGTLSRGPLARGLKPCGRCNKCAEKDKVRRI